MFIAMFVLLIVSVSIVASLVGFLTEDGHVGYTMASMFAAGLLMVTMVLLGNFEHARKEHSKQLHKDRNIICQLKGGHLDHEVCVKGTVVSTK